jgi:hypothetical protein
VNRKAPVAPKVYGTVSRCYHVRSPDREEKKTLELGRMMAWKRVPSLFYEGKSRCL